MTRLRTLARRRNGDGHSLREALEDLIEEHEEEGAEDRAEFTEEERELLLNALSFGELQVWDVMVPRSDVKAIGIGASLAEVLGTMRDAMHTRLPVYRENLDEVIGMVHIKDLLPYWGDGADFALERIVREVLFVPPSMRVLDLLLQMRDTGVHMAIVVDEYGGTDGLATIEDLVEEIVGEIQDEHDKILPPRITELPDGVLEADARVEVEDLEQRLGLQLLEPERREDVDTLGGLLFTLLDRVPARGEVVRHPAGLEFEVLDADPRRIKRLRIHKVARDRPGAGRLSAGRAAAAGQREPARRRLARGRPAPPGAERRPARRAGGACAAAAQPLAVPARLRRSPPSGARRPRAVAGAAARLELRLRPLPGGPVLDRDRVLHRRRALRPAGGAGGPPAVCRNGALSGARHRAAWRSGAGAARPPPRSRWRSPGPRASCCAARCSAASRGT